MAPCLICTIPNVTLTLWYDSIFKIVLGINSQLGTLPIHTTLLKVMFSKVIAVSLILGNSICQCQLIEKLFSLWLGPLTLLCPLHHSQYTMNLFNSKVMGKRGHMKVKKLSKSQSDICCLTSKTVISDVIFKLQTFSSHVKPNNQRKHDIQTVCTVETAFAHPIPLTPRHLL